MVFQLAISVCVGDGATAPFQRPPSSGVQLGRFSVKEKSGMCIELLSDLGEVFRKVGKVYNVMMMVKLWARRGG